MTKKQLLEMIKNYGDNEELVFVYEELDRDGYPEDRIARGIYKVVRKEHYKVVREEYGIHRIYDKE